MVYMVSRKTTTQIFCKIRLVYEHSLKIIRKVKDLIFQWCINLNLIIRIYKNLYNSIRNYKVGLEKNNPQL